MCAVSGGVALCVFAGHKLFLDNGVPCVVYGRIAAGCASGEIICLEMEVIFLALVGIC